LGVRTYRALKAQRSRRIDPVPSHVDTLVIGVNRNEVGFIPEAMKIFWGGGSRPFDFHGDPRLGDSAVSCAVRKTRYRKRQYGKNPRVRDRYTTKPHVFIWCPGGDSNPHSVTTGGF